jgi:hypothetical protein
MLERVFGPKISLSTGRVIPTRWVGEQHVQQDLGFHPVLRRLDARHPASAPVGRAGRLEDRPHRAATLPADSGERRDQS